MQAVLGITQLTRVDRMNAERGHLAALYRERLADIPELIPLAQPAYEYKDSYHLMVVRLDIDRTGITRDDFMSELKKRNIGTGLHFRCVHGQKYYRENCPVPAGSLPNVVSLYGAKPVFVDCDRDTLMITADAIGAAITPRTKAIVPVHFAGGVLELDKIRAVAARHNVVLIEDAAHALGAEFKGERIGKHGHVMFSFHPIKNITTGEGGMFATDDSELADRVRSLKFHGLGVDAYDRQTMGRAPQAQVVEPGFKFNMPDMQAVLGITQLTRVDRMNAERGHLASLYRERLANIPELTPLAQPAYEYKDSYHLMVVRLDINKTGITRDDFMAELKKRNIGTGLHFRCVHGQKYYREACPVPAGSLPNTEWNSERIFSLPFFPGMSDADVDDVIEACKEILAR
jgi:UDP-4-amino-4-deoxy-L-arabinose-oxoglutarate aminotransferase